MLRDGGGLKPLVGFECKRQLEIWGKAQRESAQRPKSDWGKLRGGWVKLPRHQSYVPELKCIGICRTCIVDLG